MGNRCNNCEWWDAPGKRETGYCLKQKPGQRVTQKDFCCPHFSEGLWQYRWNPESIARRAKQESNKSNVGGGAKKHLAYWMEKPKPPKGE